MSQDPAPGSAAIKPMVFLEVAVEHDDRMRHVAIIGNNGFWEWLAGQGAGAQPSGEVLDRLRSRTFTVFCDEPQPLGGDDEHPSPLEFFLAGAGFCLVTQVTRLAKRMKVDVTGVKVAISASWGQRGGLWAGTIEGAVTDFVTRLEIRSDAPPEQVAALVHNARASCFAETALRQAVDVKAQVTLNGVDFDYQSYPKRPKR